MTITEFMDRHHAAGECLDAPGCLNRLLADMDRGLRGQGPIPMIPSYLKGGTRPSPGSACCVLDAGGTNLRTARAVFGPDGVCRLEELEQTVMPGTTRELNFEEFYSALARSVERLGSYERVGFCFSYNVTLDRTLDGPLDFWCKEVRVPEAVGQPVGASLRAALGKSCRSVHVLNDSVAAMLGAGDVQVGVILGTGINACYSEPCRRIPKVPADLKAESMIISTEVGEFDGFPRSDFEETVIAASATPDAAPAEKQCSGGYLGDVIAAAWHAAKREGLLEQCPPADLGSVSRLLRDCPGTPAAKIAAIAIQRAAKIAAVLCAGPMLRAAGKNSSVRVAVEGSQYWRLTGFREAFHQELDNLLPQLSYEIVHAENACLIGAAIAAWADPM
ncbi:MAG: hypothetical protein J6B70_01525 [Oscillospiraceae bacterium]|nr:hypothetical protein [Oscillospiraceae bacterium]